RPPVSGGQEVGSEGIDGAEAADRKREEAERQWAPVPAGGEAARSAGAGFGHLDGGREPGIRGAVHDAGVVEEGARGGRLRGALRQGARTEAFAAGDRGSAARGGHRAEAGASGVRDAADPRRAQAVRGDRDQRDGGAPDAARGRTAGNGSPSSET